MKTTQAWKRKAIADSNNEGLWSVDEEDDDVERSPTINYSNMIEPGWDVDSYDGYECYDSDDRKSFSYDEEYEEFREFKFQAWKNKVTYPILYPLSYPLNLLIFYVFDFSGFCRRRSIQVHLPPY